jgi:hypothetical protein
MATERRADESGIPGRAGWTDVDENSTDAKVTRNEEE